MMNTGRQIPGMLKASVRDTHDQLTWELNQLVQGLFPTPPMGAVSTLLGSVNMTSFSYVPMNTTVTFNMSDFLFAGSNLTVTGTMVGIMGPQSNLRTHIVGKYTVPSGMWTDDGNLVLDWTADQSTGLGGAAIDATANWAGTKLLVERDQAASKLHFLLTATGITSTDAQAEYHAKGLGAQDATTDIDVTAQTTGGTVTAAHGRALFVTPSRPEGR